MSRLRLVVTGVDDKKTIAMILLLFFCSGATALVYEVVWSKYLSLMFGSTIYAQTIVLAVFMGGLALGNLLIGRRADFLKAPLAGYGRLEVIIGLYAFCFSWLYQAVDRVFVSAGSRLIDLFASSTPASRGNFKGVIRFFSVFSETPVHRKFEFEVTNLGGRCST